MDILQRLLSKLENISFIGAWTITASCWSLKSHKHIDGSINKGEEAEVQACSPTLKIMIPPDKNHTL